MLNPWSRVNVSLILPVLLYKNMIHLKMMAYMLSRIEVHHSRLRANFKSFFFNLWKNTFLSTGGISLTRKNLAKVFCKAGKHSPSWYIAIYLLLFYQTSSVSFFLGFPVELPLLRPMLPDYPKLQETSSQSTTHI